MKEKEKNGHKSFRFKKFSASDDRCGMKLGTDGVLLGAWASVRENSRVLDIGSGCGIIGLMAAQRGAREVTCVEIDYDAACQCRQNAERSPWSDRIETLCGDFLELAPGLPRFDNLISNPPFYADQTKAPELSRSMARQGAGLSCAAIISLAPSLLNPEGVLSLICPVSLNQEILYQATLARLSVTRLTEVCSAQGREPIRHLWEFSLLDASPLFDRICIKDVLGDFTPEYRGLVRDFYLNID